MNFVAVLAVLAATAFTLPLLVQGGEALGLARGVSVAASLVVALVLALALAVRAVVLAWRRSSARRPSVLAQRSAGSPPAAPRTQAAGLVDTPPQGLRAGLRLVDAEEESRAGL